MRHKLQGDIATCNPVQFSLEKLNVAGKKRLGALNHFCMQSRNQAHHPEFFARLQFVPRLFEQFVLMCTLLVILSPLHASCLCTARDYVTQTHFLPLLHAPLNCVQQASFTSLHVTAKLPCNIADCVLRPELLLCHGRNYVFIFYSFELKLCRMVELCIPKNPIFFVFDFNSFWRENDVKRLTAKFQFRFMAKQRNDFGRA